jgi:hypothetical protein
MLERIGRRQSTLADPKEGYLVGDSFSDEFCIVGDAICDFSCSETIEEGDILTKDGLKV